MGEGGWLILFLIAQRLIELAIAHRNTARLLARGAVEFGRVHYSLIVGLHIAWIACLWLFGREQPVSRAWLSIFIVLQLLRGWTMLSLGRHWTTRVIVLPGAPLSARGPYRYLRHPNYLIVMLEIAVVPLALGLPLFALVFFVLNAGLLAWRIRVENAALASVTKPEPGPKILANKGLRL